MSLPALQPYQVVIAVMAAIMITQGIYNFTQHKTAQSPLKLIVRLIVWGGMAAITLHPPITYWLARAVGIEGNINAVVLIGFLLIFLFLFKLLSIIEKIEQNISALIRKDAITALKKREDQ